MRKIVLFSEDFGHEEFLIALLKRLTKNKEIGVSIQSLSVRGGYGKVTSELKEYLRDIRSQRITLPDLIIVATDANCKGLGQRKQEVNKVIPKDEYLKNAIVHAIPDPHIERWMLLDSNAFKTVFGRGCSLPDQKCQRDRYKELLLKAIQNAGVIPPLGGMEYAKEIINAMDLSRIEKQDKSFSNLIQNLNKKLVPWIEEDHFHKVY